MFPSTLNPTLELALERILWCATNIKNQTNFLINLTQITRKQLIDYINIIASELSALDTYSAITGVGAYAQTQLGNESLNIVAEFTTMRTQIVNVQDWIIANFPKDASNNLAVYSFDVNKRYVDVYFTAGELTAIKTQLTNLVNTIN